MVKTLKKIRQRIQDEKGVSLMEVVIILLIMAMTVVPLSRLAMKNSTSTGKYATMNRAILHAEETMEQIVADYAATEVGRGYDWVVTNWSGRSTLNTPAGLSGIVTISAEDTLRGSAYVEVTTTVRGTDIEDVVLTTWLVK